MERELVRIKSIERFVNDAVLSFLAEKHAADEIPEDDPGFDPVAERQLELGFSNRSMNHTSIRSAILERRALGRIVVREADGFGVIRDDDVMRGTLGRDDFARLLSDEWRISLFVSTSTGLEPVLVTAGARSQIEPAKSVAPAEPALTVVPEPKLTKLDVPTDNSPDRGRRLKRDALISENWPRWQSIERDLKDAASNGLADTAKADHGYWWEGSALAWAEARNKIGKTPMTALPRKIHRIT